MKGVRCLLMKLSEEEALYFYKKYFRLLKHIAWRILHSKEEAENIAQDTFLKAFNSDKNPHSHNFSAYITTICKNAALDRKKALSRIVPLSENILLKESADSPKENAEANLLLEKLQSILTAEEFDILIFRIYYQLSFKEISQLVSSTSSKLIPRYHRIKKKVEKALGGRL